MVFFNAIFNYACIIYVFMKEKFSKSKFQQIVVPILYFLIVVAFVGSALFAFDRLYYENIYVSGSSMQPTLIGNKSPGRAHYGKADKSNRAIDNLQRFDVVITYFPNSWEASSSDEKSYKIKRVWGFPGERITLTNDGSFYTFSAFNSSDDLIETYQAPVVYDKTYSWNLAYFTVKNKTFRTHCDSPRTFDRKLEADEYFVMGDNWGQSSDSYQNCVVSHHSEYITRGYLKGRVVQILGTAVVVNEKLTDKQKIKGMYNF